ncbi:MAG TPA: tRNA (adenosine(37)-N6)-threonylcarbamoyltransferase complex ATPase subunit type 1 TsaE [Clostridia bacterium]|jgi:tRNA threonylcarbamoyladenosine biosynthesis protein TsaE|nr:tRNA (adenosine(37)-N6)-threonylcarbamoyltransferase complex ATPase subunit type 1 TsaE [Clostridia bacterium]NLF36652.1 tRNA (adenosine(37)-N6)-threonylcarbamoyltransferase complex ATPase subunit type 1 TsaE [Clostridiaceae bacterium]MDD3093976.1 tRNA (adenosine(37)-N6)-threonylcarbamoyltransferase complex ATPase subunit type 1 TsaE [Clostridia bacterium]MDD3972061.1 tRNA (adenosine(37)-N6)-threonylcarbamoyltransferase complex ATPase subunit type 1 TsaE [Clostridia bacterium]HPJ75833.1 tRNA
MTKTYVIATGNELDTIELGKVMAAVFENRVVAVSGDLGAGKTHLAKGFALGLGIEKHITSPTFNIMNVYTKNDKTFYHIDAYRLTDPDMIYDIGIEEALEPKGITLIEWAENVEHILNKGYVKIYIEKTDDENKRLMFITADKESIDRMAKIIYEDTVR